MIMGGGYDFTITHGTGAHGIRNAATPEDAKYRCISFAVRSGWTRPRWWQFWRYGETQIIQADVDEAMRRYP